MEQKPKFNCKNIIFACRTKICRADLEGKVSLFKHSDLLIYATDAPDFVEMKVHIELPQRNIHIYDDDFCFTFVKKPEGMSDEDVIHLVEKYFDDHVTEDLKEELLEILDKR